MRPNNRLQQNVRCNCLGQDLPAELLHKAERSEGGMPAIFKYKARAYGLTGQLGKAELATAEAALLQGDKALALQKAKLAQARFKAGTPEWTRANDILNFASRD